MFHRLLAILVIGALLLQSGREAAIGLWFWANQQWVTEHYCVNKEEPLLMCQGKCYLQKVIETEAPEKGAPLGKLPAPEERMPFNALLAPRSFKAVWPITLVFGKPSFHYLAPCSVECGPSLFRPPRV
ncbi:MAG: hypothetical protein H6558_19320 [Lewinellaceae bacterium]|nr:hypothetical protein [Lewinellaceae bacterium]MCB9289149.1 hypothetical protein [Lewinellaceae bacterium]